MLVDLSNPETKIRFSNAEEDQNYLLRRLDQCNHKLNEGKKRPKLQDFISEDAEDEMPLDLLEQANTIHQLLRQHWTCDCTTALRTVNLNLANFRSPQAKAGPLKFDLLFSASDVGSKWQEGEVLIHPFKYDVTHHIIEEFQSITGTGARSGFRTMTNLPIVQEKQP
jgi:hypothetical protein